MKKRLLSSLLVMSLVVAGLSGCGKQSGETAKSDGGTADNGDKIQIAVAAPMTGDNSEYGIGFYNAVLLKAKEWNDNGGVLGKQIEIVQYDCVG